MKTIPTSHKIIVAACILSVIIALVCSVLAIDYFTEDTKSYAVDFKEPQTVLFHLGDSLSHSLPSDNGHKIVLRAIRDNVNAVSNFKTLENVDVTKLNCAWVEYKYDKSISFTLTVDGKRTDFKTDSIYFIFNGDYEGCVSVNTPQGQHLFGSFRIDEEALSVVLGQYSSH